MSRGRCFGYCVCFWLHCGYSGQKWVLLSPLRGFGLRFSASFFVTDVRRMTNVPGWLSYLFLVGIPEIERLCLELLAAGAVEVFPAVALLDDGFEVFLPDDAVLDGVFDDGACEAGGEVGGAEGAVAEVGGEGQAAVHDGDGFGGAEGAAEGDLILVLPSAVRPLRSSRKMVTTRRISSRAGGSAGISRARPRSVDAAADDLDFLVRRFRVGGG